MDAKIILSSDKLRIGSLSPQVPLVDPSLGSESRDLWGPRRHLRARLWLFQGHVRVLTLRPPALHSDILETALPHLTSLPNLQELDVGQTLDSSSRIDISRVSLNILVPIFSSCASTLRRLQWTQKYTAHETWKTLYTLTDILPNLTDIELSEISGSIPVTPSALPRIRFSSDSESPDPLAFKHFRFQELEVTRFAPVSPPFLEYCQIRLRVLELGSDGTHASGYYENLQVLLKVCHALQEVIFPFNAFIGQTLVSIPSNSVSLIQLRDPPGIGGTTYNSRWGQTPRIFEFYRESLERRDIPEYERLGVSIRKIAQRFSDHHRGRKTRVRLIHWPTKTEAQTIDNGEIPFFMTKLTEELGSHVILELDLLSPQPEGPE